MIEFGYPADLPETVVAEVNRLARAELASEPIAATKFVWCAGPAARRTTLIWCPAGDAAARIAELGRDDDAPEAG